MIKMNQLRARYRLFNNYKDYFRRVSFLDTMSSSATLNITFSNFKQALLDANMIEDYLKVESNDNMPFFGFEVEKIWEKYMSKQREMRINKYLEGTEEESQRIMNAFDKEYFLATRFESKEKLKIVDISTKLIHELN